MRHTSARGPWVSVTLTLTGHCYLISTSPSDLYLFTSIFPLIYVIIISNLYYFRRLTKTPLLFFSYTLPLLSLNLWGRFLCHTDQEYTESDFQPIQTGDRLHGAWIARIRKHFWIRYLFLSRIHGAVSRKCSFYLHLHGNAGAEWSDWICCKDVMEHAHKVTEDRSRDPTSSGVANQSSSKSHNKPHHFEEPHCYQTINGMEWFNIA